MAQINSTVGDFSGNRQKIIRDIERAREMGCALVTFPELAVTGYPPEDLLFKPAFIRKNTSTLESIIPHTAGITAVIGFVDDGGSCLYNAAAVISDGKLKAVYRKMILPNYGVFDEQRYFKPGRECPLFDIAGVGVGITICEDIWQEGGPAAEQVRGGAEIILNISSSPYHAGKWREREEMLAARACQLGVMVAYNNQVGGQDELVFDGGSLVVGYDGRPLVRGPQFEEALIALDLEIKPSTAVRFKEHADNDSASGQGVRYMVSQSADIATRPAISPQVTAPLEMPVEVYRALVLGTRDYVLKNGFERVVIGLSGGIDSSLVAVIAADALGADRVTGVAMPSRFSSQGSLEDARLLCDNLGINLLTMPIEPLYRTYLESLSDVFRDVTRDTTEENIQARIRGNLLMALSNKFGWLVLTTGNKSEMATGYTTLYGDMAGGFAVIKDVPKTLVYKLSLARNAGNGDSPIPAGVLAKPPSAELRLNQQDSDSLPPYDVLDPILTAYVEQDKGVDEIVALGFEAAVVRQVAHLVDMSEYKRRQSPPGVKITLRAFGRDRRLPITNRFRGV
jgi:NAD+ synthase (glutamine-hydrolysing)